MYTTGNYKICYTRCAYIIIIFILDIINDNNYCIDNECKEKQSSSNGKYFKSLKQFFLKITFFKFF